MGQRFEERNRPIIGRYCDRETVTRNVFKLRGSKIIINEDLCPASEAIEKAQLPQLKATKNQGITAFSRHTKLIIKDKTNAPAQGTPIVMNQSSSEASVELVQASRDSRSFPFVAAMRWLAVATLVTRGRRSEADRCTYCHTCSQQ